MRYDTPVYFLTTTAEYNKTTGNYDNVVTAEEKQWASVTDTGEETLNILYGEIKQGVKTIQLQNHYDKPFDRIRIGKEVYRVDRARRLRTKHIFIASEVQ